MKRRYKLLLLGILFLLSVSVVFGQDFGQAFEPFFDLMGYIFTELGSSVIFRKFLLWMVLFAVLNILVKRLPFIEDKDKSRANVISLIISLIGIIGIPNSAINLIFEEYSLVAFLAFYLLIPILLFLATRNIANPRIRGIVFIISGLLLFIGAGAVSSGNWARNYSTFSSWLFIGASIMVIYGIIQLFSSSAGEPSGATTSTPTSTTSKTTQPAEQPKSDEEALEKLRKEFGKLEKYLEKIEVELRNFALIDAEEIERAEKQHNMLSQAEALFNQKDKIDHRTYIDIIKDLTEFKRFLQSSEKVHWWGVRSLSRIAAREENEIKQIQSTIDYLKNHEDENVRTIIQHCEELFRNIDQFTSYIMGIRQTIIDERNSNHKIEDKINDLLNKLQIIVKEITTKPKTEEDVGARLLKIGSLIKTIETDLDSLIIILRKLYGDVREAHTIAPKIKTKVKQLIGYSKHVQQV